MKKLIVNNSIKTISSIFDGNYTYLEDNSWSDSEGNIEIIDRLNEFTSGDLQRYLEELEGKYIEAKSNTTTPLQHSKIGLVDFVFYSEYFKTWLIQLDSSIYQVVENNKINNFKREGFYYDEISTQRFNNIIFLSLRDQSYGVTWINEITREQYLEYIENKSNWESD